MHQCLYIGGSRSILTRFDTSVSRWKGCSYLAFPLWFYLNNHKSIDEAMIKINILMMLVLKVLVIFAPQPKNALPQMLSYWSSNAKIRITFCMVRYHNVI